MDDTPQEWDPFEELRRLVGDPRPTVEQTEAARARLQEVVNAEIRAGRAQTRPRRRRLISAAVAIAGLAMALGVGVMVLRPDPAKAIFGELARAARVATPGDVPEGSFIHTRISQLSLVYASGDDLGLDRHQVAFLHTSDIERWRQPEAGFIRIAHTLRDVEFFDPEVEAAYKRMGGYGDEPIGETVVTQYVDSTDPTFDTDWPTSPPALRAAMEADAPPDMAGRSLDVWILGLVCNILRDVVDPELRGAALEVLATVGFDHIERHGDGTVTLTIIPDELPRVQETKTIDSDGWLIVESIQHLDAVPELGIPANQTTFHATYERPKIVESLPDD